MQSVQPDKPVVDLVVGATVYSDRAYTVKAVPELVAGGCLVQMAMGERSRGESTFLTLTLAPGARLYMAYDHRRGLPAWLQRDYTNRGVQLQTTDVPLTLWEWRGEGLVVVIPGNNSEITPVQGGSMYAVVVR